MYIGLGLSYVIEFVNTSKVRYRSTTERQVPMQNVWVFTLLIFIYVQNGYALSA